MKFEPVIFTNALGALLFAVLTFLVNSGVLQVSAEQQDLVKTIIGAVIGLAVTLISRSQVVPVAKL